MVSAGGERPDEVRQHDVDAYETGHEPSGLVAVARGALVWGVIRILGVAAPHLPLPDARPAAQFLGLCLGLQRVGKAHEETPDLARSLP